MKTAVELIEEKIKFQMKSAKMDKNNSVEWSMSIVIKRLENLYFDVCEQAKEMERQQIKSARHSGRQDLRDNGAMYKEDEQYYNETYSHDTTHS
jgi:hypothetical protein